MTRPSFQQGDHVCALYGSIEEQRAAAAEYVRAGLARGERCLFVCREGDPGELRAALSRAGIDVAKEESRTALVILTREETYFQGGASFDPQRMIRVLETAVRDAVRAGFDGLCAAGDMHWVLDDAAGRAKLAEYESLLDEFYGSYPALGLCFYSRRELPAGTIDDALATHRIVQVDGRTVDNPFHEPAEIAARRASTATVVDVEQKVARLLDRCR